MTAVEKPYAGNDLGLEAMRRAGWIRTLATWARCSRPLLVDTMALEAATGLVKRDLAELVRREIFHPLEPVEVMVAESHADYLVRGDFAILAEVRGIALRIPPEIFPRFVPFPRLDRLDQETRTAATRARERLRAVGRAIRGREADPWD